MQALGSVIRNVRKARNFTQESLGAALDLEQTQVSRVERGMMRLTREQQAKAAEFLGISLAALDKLVEHEMELEQQARAQSQTEQARSDAADTPIPAGFATLSLIVPEWLLTHFRAAQFENVGGTDGSLMAAMTAAYLLSPANVRQSLRRWAAWRTVNPPAEVDIAEAAPLMAVEPEPAVFRQDADNTPSPPGVTPQRQKRMERVLSLAEEPVQHDGFWAQVHRMITLADLPPTEAAPSQQAPPRTASGG